ncbi:molecular chaperone SurA [Massilia arenosa]|uniref:Chaperone SurA n=1 Tax=Zemynaea arenosa TaxID=2561931 RepID=A0A4Y9S112_9BURK|nr:peptidylprolyl isomerase [Massilia arenosa]TFW15014.1 molecular chaperone SurA [Massilia arenosa]
MHQLKIAAALLCATLAGTAGAQSQPAAPAAAPAPAIKGFLPPASSSANVIDQIAVVVNDDIITKNELAARVADIVKRSRANNQPLPDEADLQRQVLEHMIVEKAQLQMAAEYGVKVDDATLDRTIARIAENQKVSVNDMRNQLEREGTTFASFREEIRNEIMMQRLREHEVDSKIQISDAEVDTFLAAEKAAAADAVEMNISQILIRIPDNATTDQINARKLRADEVMRQLRTGADFAKMAATYSDAPDALKGGEVGWRDPNRLPPIFATELGKLKPGQVTQPIKSSTGFHILKLVDKRSVAPQQTASAVVEQTHARHILIKPTPTLSAADARKKLAEIKAKIESKQATFEEMAKQFSTDNTAQKGGDLGWLSPGDTVPEFETVMNTLRPGQLSDVVESPFGLHIVEVLERKQDDQTKQKERMAARQVLFERKLAEASEDWARQIRDRAFVEYRMEELR